MVQIFLTDDRMEELRQECSLLMNRDLDLNTGDGRSRFYSWFRRTAKLDLWHDDSGWHIDVPEDKAVEAKLKWA